MGKPVVLFEAGEGLQLSTHNGILPDGDRFLVGEPLDLPEEVVKQFNVAFNWFEELKRLAPTE